MKAVSFEDVDFMTERTDPETEGGHYEYIANRHFRPDATAFGTLVTTVGRRIPSISNPRRIGPGSLLIIFWKPSGFYVTS